MCFLATSQSQAGFPCVFTSHLQRLWSIPSGTWIERQTHGRSVCEGEMHRVLGVLMLQLGWSTREASLHLMGWLSDGVHQTINRIWVPLTFSKSHGCCPFSSSLPPVSQHALVFWMRWKRINGMHNWGNQVCTHRLSFSIVGEIAIKISLGTELCCFGGGATQVKWNHFF